MRDRRFVALHRGGALVPEHHRMLALWAAECATRAVAASPRALALDAVTEALALARGYSRGEVSVGEARRAAIRAHACARAETEPRDVFAIRAAAHAVATAHAADHSLAAAYYARKAAPLRGVSVEAERSAQLALVPEELRELVASAEVTAMPRPTGSLVSRTRRGKTPRAP